MLGPVDIHRVARTDPTRCIIAEKLAGLALASLEDALDDLSNLVLAEAAMIRHGCVSTDTTLDP